MSIALRYLALVATPSVAFVLGAKALEFVSTYDSHGPRAARPTRGDLAARIERLQAEYDDLAAHRPAAKAHKLRAAALALADAKDDLFRHDVASSLSGAERSPARLG